jgi:hypothetical protein
MITREKYLEALDIVEAYHKQFNLSIVMHNDSIKTYDLMKGDYVENLGSSSKHVTKGKKYLITKVYHHHNSRGFEPKTMQNYERTVAWILDDNGKQRRMVWSNSSLWKKVSVLGVLDNLSDCECDGEQDLKAGTGECRKCGGQCTY